MLETIDVAERLELAIELQKRAPCGDGRSAAASARTWRAARPSQQREYILRRKKSKSIRKRVRRGRSLGRRRVPPEARRRGPARGRARAGGVGAQPARAPGRRLTRGVDDPPTTSTGCSPCRGASPPRSGSIEYTRTRCSTPSQPASTTSRTGSSSMRIAVRKLREEHGRRAGQALGRDPRRARRPARHGQDLPGRSIAGRWDASSCASHWAVCATRPRSAG